MEIAVTTPGDDDELTKLVVRVRGGNAAAFEELAGYAIVYASGLGASSPTTMKPRTWRSSCWCECTSDSMSSKGEADSAVGSTA